MSLLSAIEECLQNDCEVMFWNMATTGAKEVRLRKFVGDQVVQGSYTWVPSMLRQTKFEPDDLIAEGISFTLRNLLKEVEK